MLYLNGCDSGKKLAVIRESVSGLDKLDSCLGALDSSGDFSVHTKTPNVKSTAILQGFAAGLLHNLEHTANKMLYYQWVRSDDWILRPLNSP